MTRTSHTTTSTDYGYWRDRSAIKVNIMEGQVQRKQNEDLHDKSDNLVPHTVHHTTKYRAPVNQRYSPHKPHAPHTLQSTAPHHICDSNTEEHQFLNGTTTCWANTYKHPRGQERQRTMTAARQNQSKIHKKSQSPHESSSLLTRREIGVVLAWHGMRWWRCGAMVALWRWLCSVEGIPAPSGSTEKTR